MLSSLNLCMERVCELNERQQVLLVSISPIHLEFLWISPRICNSTAWFLWGPPILQHLGWLSRARCERASAEPVYLLRLRRARPQLLLPLRHQKKSLRKKRIPCTSFKPWLGISGWCSQVQAEPPSIRLDDTGWVVDTKNNLTLKPSTSLGWNLVCCSS